MRDQQLSHLISNTPMKLLTTIAAVLISISAFSQDLIKYENGTFSQNGEELSMEQIDDFTKHSKVGRGNFRRGYKFNRMHKDGDLRIWNNGLNFLGGSAAALPGVVYTIIGRAVVLIGDEDYIDAGYVLLGSGIGLCVVSYKAFSRIALSPAGCLRKRDKKFNKVADRLNQVIAAEGPTVQSPNQ